MLLDPNRWPKPFPMISSNRRFVIVFLALVAGVIGLLFALPALDALIV